jgi:hypothetical protein
VINRAEQWSAAHAKQALDDATEEQSNEVVGDGQAKAKETRPRPHAAPFAIIVCPSGELVEQVR